MTRDELVEKVARALFEAHPWGGGAWSSLPEEWRDVHRKQAIAGFAALREPSEEMIEAGVTMKAFYMGRTEDIWRAMIRALLPEEPST